MLIVNHPEKATRHIQQDLYHPSSWKAKQGKDSHFRLARLGLVQSIRMGPSHGDHSLIFQMKQFGNQL